MARQKRHDELRRKARRLQESQAEVVFKLLESESGETESAAAQRVFQGFDTPGQHINTWMAVSTAGRLQGYLEKAELSPEEQRVLRAEMEAHYSVYEVVEMDGSRLLLKDCLRDAPLELHDSHAAERLQPGRFILVRVIEVEGVLAVSGSFGIDIGADRAQPLCETVLAGQEELSTEALQKPEFAELLFGHWRLAENNEIPTHNDQGERMALVSRHYSGHEVGLEEIKELFDGNQAGPNLVQWGPPGKPPQAIMQATEQGWVLKTFSVDRSRRFAERLEQAFGERLPFDHELVNSDLESVLKQVLVEK